MTKVLGTQLKHWIEKIAADRSGKSEEQFWDFIREAGTPLIEDAPDDPDSVVVSFIAKGSENINSFAVIGGFLDWDAELGSLEKIADTEIWFKSILRPRDAFGSYRLCPNYSPAEDSDWKVLEKKLVGDPHQPSYFWIG